MRAERYNHSDFALYSCAQSLFFLETVPIRKATIFTCILHVQPVLEEDVTQNLPIKQQEVYVAHTAN